jgi:hypothetical protein
MRPIAKAWGKTPDKNAYPDTLKERKVEELVIKNRNSGISFLSNLATKNMSLNIKRKRLKVRRLAQSSQG